jgi:hypothetical protein
MEGLDEKTLAELKAKAIERGGYYDEDKDVSTNEIDTASETEEIIIPEEKPVKDVKKPKRQRSEKQIAAFEKARIKRAENLKIKKQIEAEKKAEIQEEKQQVKLEVKKRLEKKQVSEGAELTETPHPSTRHNPIRPKDVHRFAGDIYDSQEQPYQRVVNNYYYYGATPSGAMQLQDPHQHAQEYYEPPAPKPRRQKIKPPEPEPEPFSDEEYSDVEEPQSYKELQNYEQEEIIYQSPAPNNGLKFRFA